MSSQKPKVTIQKSADETSRTFQLAREDHTLGNALRYTLMRRPEVTFCGYSIPHPAEPIVNVRLQTSGAAATDVLRAGLMDLAACCDLMTASFEEATNAHMEEHPDGA